MRWWWAEQDWSDRVDQETLGLAGLVRPGREGAASGETLPDFLGSDGKAFIASSHLLSALNLPPEVLGVEPAEIAVPNHPARVKGYWLASVQLEVEERLDFEVLIEPSRTAPGSLFRLENYLVVSDDVAEHVMQAGCTGIQFINPWRYREERALGGEVQKRRRRPAGVLPKRLFGPRPVYVPRDDIAPELRAIEDCVRHRLPEAYLRFLRSAPPGPAASSWAAVRWFTDTAEILEANVSVRTVPGEVEWVLSIDGWPADWLIIGQTGGYDDVCLDLGADDERVVILLRNLPGARHYADNLAAFLAQAQLENEE